MWELIRQNRRKSIILLAGMGLCLLLLGYILGAAFWGEGGGKSGLILAFLIWVILSLVSYFSGDSIILKMAGAREVTPDVHPQLFNVVEEMKIASGLPVMPKVYIIDTPAPNAFATGRKPEKCAIAVTAGLLSRLNRDQLQGVIAHETSHIYNRDILFMTFAGVMLGSVVVLSRIFFYGGMRGGGSSRRYRSRKSSGGGGVPIVAIIAIAFAILAPIMSHLLYMAISRRREYLADATAVRLTRYPEGLASALEKISQSTDDMPGVNKVTAPLFIVNPIKKKGMKLSDLSATHPPISERIRILRSISRGIGLSGYHEAYLNVTGKPGIIPASALKDPEEPAITSRGTGTEKPQPQTGKEGARELGDLMRAVNQYLFVACACGLKIKLPPDFKKKEFNCPRCDRKLTVPVAELAAASAVAEQLQDTKGSATDSPEQKLTYSRRGEGWESFACSCGNRIQISPALESDKIQCPQCRRTIHIK